MPSSQDIFFLHSTDEVRHPYEKALKRLSHDVKWFFDFREIVEASHLQPFIVVVDLDVLDKPWDATIEHLRRLYPKSDLIALSSSDSAHSALMCLRTGFSDFLIKPLSPEELAWSIKKCEQRLVLVRQIEDPKSLLVKTITQISSCTTPTLVRLCTLEFFERLFHSKGVAWIDPTGALPRVLCSIPKELSDIDVIKQIPQSKFFLARGVPRVLRSKKDNTLKLLFSNQHSRDFILVWGSQVQLTKVYRQSATTLLEHAEVSLLNLEKFEEVKQQTFIDDLTGLYNSRYLKYAISNAINRCRKPNSHFSVLFIDVDHFKAINDKNGHLVGSDFLVAIGKTVRNAVRNIDAVFRYGGDEFVVILTDTDVPKGFEIAERIRKQIERRVFNIRGVKLQATVSIGLANFPLHAQDQETLLRLADEAMYHAKKDTRNAVHLALGLEQMKKAV